MISRVLNKVLLLVAVVASKNSFKIVPESVFMYLLVAKGWKGGGERLLAQFTSPVRHCMFDYVLKTSEDVFIVSVTLRQQKARESLRTISSRHIMSVADSTAQHH